jgi:concanavalin A-like lectin/glucanase superfamily protein/F5/8 type C domain-containing protein
MCKKLIFLICIASMFAGQSYAAIDPDTILAIWLLDEGTGDMTADASGNGHDGTLVGSPNWVTGYFGNALEFNGSSTCVDCGSAPTLNVEVFSVSFWCNIPRTQGWNHMISRGEHHGGGNPGAVNWGVMMYDAQETILYETYNDTVKPSVSASTTTGEWHHVVATHDGAEMQLYHDGQLVEATPTAGITLDENLAFIIGAQSRAGGPSDYFDGRLDEVGYFNAVLAPEDIETIMNEGLAEIVGGSPVAANPQPTAAQTDVPRDPVLSWTAGEFAATHNVYFGDNFDDVNNGVASALIADGIAETTVAPGRLAFETTYYWRVDEVNAAPDYTVFEGVVWSFTVEPLAYPVEGVMATSNGSSDATAGPENTVNGSGLNANDEHSVAATDMWLATPGAEPLWIQYAFDRVYRLHEMLVWNYNVQFELILGFGLKDVTVEYSENGTDWTVLGDVEFARAPATSSYAHNTTIDFQGAVARYVRLSVNSGWGMLGQYGLSEVRFTFIPVLAREPQPDDGATDVSPDVVLSWRPGREAASHAVYLDIAPDALALAETVTDNSYAPAELAFGTAYSWKIDEVNEAEVPSVWEGDLWTFSTLEFAVIEDFERYDDEENTIFDTWIDGFVNDTGSTVGYFDAPFAERSIVNSGRQSMPLEYANGAAPFHSETSRAWAAAQDWTMGGAVSLRLHFYGSPDNVPGSLYVGIEDAAGNVAVVTHPDPDALLADSWQAWTIPLSEFSAADVNLARVETMILGIGDRDNPTAGGAGLVFIDDIEFGTSLASDIAAN